MSKNILETVLEDGGWEDYKKWEKNGKTGYRKLESKSETLNSKMKREEEKKILYVF